MYDPPFCVYYAEIQYATKFSQSYDRHWSQELTCLAVIAILRGTNVRLIFYDWCDVDVDGGTDVVNNTWSSVAQPRSENQCDQ